MIKLAKLKYIRCVDISAYLQTWLYIINHDFGISGIYNLPGFCETILLCEEDNMDTIKFFEDHNEKFLENLFNGVYVYNVRAPKVSVTKLIDGKEDNDNGLVQQIFQQ